MSGIIKLGLICVLGRWNALDLAGEDNHRRSTEGARGNASKNQLEPALARIELPRSAEQAGRDQTITEKPNLCPNLPQMALVVLKSDKINP